MTELVLILEDALNRTLYHFNDTSMFEDFLKTINLNDYEYKNILFYVDDELHYKISKMFRDVYIRQAEKLKKAKEKYGHLFTYTN